jgi:hypothetical protein
MMPIWTLKLGSVAVTLASTAGFWQYVTQHVHPARAPLKPKVEQPVADDASTAARTGWDMSADAMQPAPTPTPVVVKKVVVVQAQQQVQNSAALGANWIANKTGQKPVQNMHVS